jgi:hypothetical protein
MTNGLLLRKRSFGRTRSCVRDIVCVEFTRTSSLISGASARSATIISVMVAVMMMELIFVFARYDNLRAFI